MRILLASSEVHPYSKTGGLADMVGALAKALARLGHEISVVTPLYRGIRDKHPSMKPLDLRLDLSLSGKRIQANVWTLQAESGVTVYFVDKPEFYDRVSLYEEHGADYADNADRFLFLSKAVVEMARVLPFQPELVHAHDWQVGLAPLLIHHQQRTTAWKNAPRLCMTVHNLAYQGCFSAAQYSLTDLPWNYFTPEGVEYYGGFSCLKAGIAFANVISTVSPRYAREITTPEFGCGLDGLLRYRQGDLTGILNGVDYDEWNTRQNPSLRHPYSAADFTGKGLGKIELQKEMGLPADERVPLFGTISRLVDQKGVDIQLGALEEMLSSNMQFVLLGSGAPAYERAYRELAERHPAKVAVRFGYNQGLAHRIEAGCDFYLMPSRYEPCGLNQMYSLRYGTVPIVRVTGGLDDTVIDVTDDPENANGIKFMEYSGRALARGIQKALALFEVPDVLRQFQRRGMAADFSWDRTAARYVELYERALE